MIWDHASNWDEEDVRALIAYLRAIDGRPIRRERPRRAESRPSSPERVGVIPKPLLQGPGWSSGDALDRVGDH